MKGDTPKTATPMPLQMPMATPAAIPASAPKAMASGGHCGCADHRGKRHDRPDGQVEASRQQRQHLPERDDHQVDRLAHGVGEVGHRQEIAREQSEDDDGDDQEERQDAKPDEKGPREIEGIAPGRGEVGIARRHHALDAGHAALRVHVHVAPDERGAMRHRKARLTLGLLLTVVGLVIALLLPGRPGSAWKLDGPLPPLRRR